MKINFKFIVLICLTLLLAACNNEKSTSQSGEEPIVLKVGSNLPPQHVMMTNILIPFMERVEEESNGRVSFKVFDSETLVRAGEELEALNAGTIDMALPMYVSYDLARFPLTEVSMLPTTHSSREINAKALSLFYNNEDPFEDGETYAERTFNNKGLVAWPSGASISYTIATTEKPIASIKDLQSLQIRVPSNIHEIFTKNIGASSINMSINETYDALSRGTFNGSYSIREDWKTFGFQEIFNYAIDDLHLGGFHSVITIQEEKFNSLPEDIQKIIQTAAIEMPDPEHNPIINDKIIPELKDIDEALISNGGVLQKFEDLPSDVQNHLNDAITQTWMDWIDNLDSKGEPGLETAIRWRDSVIEAGGDVTEGIKDLTMP